MPTSFLPGPGLISTTDEVRLRIPGLVSVNITATAVCPSGVELDLTGFVRNLPGPVVTGKDLVYTFSRKGSWLIRVRDNVSGDVWYIDLFAAEWPLNVDMKLSEVNRVKVETERLRSVLGSEVRRNG